MIPTQEEFNETLKVLKEWVLKDPEHRIPIIEMEYHKAMYEAIQENMRKAYEQGLKDTTE